MIRVFEFLKHIDAEENTSFPEKLSAFDTSCSDSQGQGGLKSFTEALRPYHKRPTKGASPKMLADQINPHVRYWQYL